MVQQSALFLQDAVRNVRQRDCSYPRGRGCESSSLTLADHSDDEMNEDIRSANLGRRFDTTLAMCAELDRRFPKLLGK